MFLGDGCLNFNILFLKIDKFSEFIVLLSRLFHSVTADGNYEFLKIMLSMFLVLDVLLTVGILLHRYLRDWFLVSLKSSNVSYTIPVIVRIANLCIDKVFP